MSIENELKNKRRRTHSIFAGIFILFVIFFGTIALIHLQQQRDYNSMYYHSTHKAMYGAAAVKTIFEQALRTGEITWDELFDDDYKRVAGTGNATPPRYTSRYSDFTDRTLQDMQDQWLYDGNIVFAATVDRNGYLPTHNSRFSQTGTENDLNWNRTKRIFDSPSVKAANEFKNDQARKTFYTRDTGEVMWVITAPIWLDNSLKDETLSGKSYWGSFHVGIGTDKERFVMDRNTQVTAIIILIVVLLTLCLPKLIDLIFHDNNKEMGLDYPVDKGKKKLAELDTARTDNERT